MGLCENALLIHDIQMIYHRRLISAPAGKSGRFRQGEDADHGKLGTFTAQSSGRFGKRVGRYGPEHRRISQNWG